MGQIQFYPDRFEVSRGGEKIVLLPKEYVLFQFLYENANRSFSRDELLDQVWKMEEPTDRTVDDHVYRLRKKLLTWNDIFSIETIRGFGYKLSIKQRTENPSLANSEIAENIQRLFQAYHGLGMGDAMQTLSANQEILGIELDPFYSVYMHFVNGDFEWLLETHSIPIWDKMIYLLHIYTMIQNTPDTALYFSERLLEKKLLLPGNWATDLRVNMIALYLETKQFERAQLQIEIAEQEVIKLNSTSFTLVLLFKKIFLAFVMEDLVAAKTWITQAEEIFASKKHLRELGIFTIIKGLWRYQLGKKQSARELVDQGFATLQQTKFVPHQLSGLHFLLYFLGKWKWDEEWEQKYQKHWRQLAARYRFAELEPKILSLLQKHL